VRLCVAHVAHVGAEGGFQGAEGHDTVAEWYISGLIEELDAANEYFYDRDAGKLYLCFNGTGVPPSTVEMPGLNELVVLKGTQANPVANVTITGLTFTGQRPTFMEPHGLPSGGGEQTRSNRPPLMDFVFVVGPCNLVAKMGQYAHFHVLEGPGLGPVSDTGTGPSST